MNERALGAEMSLYRWIVDHPVAVWMITLATMVFGMVSYARLPLNLMPDLSYPTLTVRTTFDGAAPEEVEQQISRPIEEALATVEGLVAVESHARAGVSDVVLEFNWDTSMPHAAQSVREQLQSLYLGEGVDRPLLLRYDPSLDPILRIALSADGKMSETELRRFAEQSLKRELESVEGVAAVLVRGGLERRVWVEAREDWLSARGVTLSLLTDALNAGNVNIAGGVVREGENEYLIRTLNEVQNLDEVRELQIPHGDTPVSVGEVATVTEGSADRKVFVRMDGADAVELQVFKEADANLVTVAAQVKTALTGYPNPEGLRWSVLDDAARFVELALQNLVRDAIMGGILCILVTFLFLRDWLTTAIISTAIPICLIATFAVMNVAGISLNLMSLGGLALGVSMVVDSGTVVLESIQRHLDAGLSRKEAAVKGTAEVATAVFASVLTGIAVFFPIVFVEGVAGQIFGDLALTVVFSLATSLIVALVFIPMLAARDLSLDAPPPLQQISTFSIKQQWQTFRTDLRFWKLPWRLMRLVLAVGLGGLLWLVTLSTAVGLRYFLLFFFHSFRLFNQVTVWMADKFLVGYGWSESIFARWLLAALKRPAQILTGGFALLFVSVLLFERVGVELIPTVHQGRFTVELALPVGTPLSVTNATLHQIEREIASLKDVATVYTVVGSEGGADARSDEGENTARILVQLQSGGDLEAREDAAMAQIRQQTEQWPHLDVHFRRPALFSVHTPLEVVIYSPDLDRLKTLSAQAEKELRKLPGVTDVSSSLTRGYPELRLHYDRQRLSHLGLSVGDIARSVRNKVQGEQAGRLIQGDRRVDVWVRLSEQDRSSIEELSAINVNPRLIPPIRLDTVASLTQGEGPSEIRRVDQRRAVVLSASLSGFDLGNAGEAAKEALRGLGAEFEVAGQSRELQTSLSSLRLALFLAIFLVYVIMASTFESLRDPLVILFSVPLSLVGVAGGLWLTNCPSSVMVFLGMIVLAGVVVANAIVLVDAIGRLRSEGLALTEAISAAAAERLRPILITALNSVLGLIPLAIGYGEGAEMQRPMAITIIFGLASSTFLTLVVVPVVYRLAVRLTERGQV